MTTKELNKLIIEEVKKAIAEAVQTANPNQTIMYGVKFAKSAFTKLNATKFTIDKNKQFLSKYVSELHTVSDELKTQNSTSAHKGFSEFITDLELILVKMQDVSDFIKKFETDYKSKF